MADIALVDPAENGYGESEINQLFQNAPFGDSGPTFFLYFCCRADCFIAADKTFLVKCAIIYNYLRFNPLSCE